MVVRTTYASRQILDMSDAYIRVETVPDRPMGPLPVVVKISEDNDSVFRKEFFLTRAQWENLKKELLPFPCNKLDFEYLMSI